MGPFDHVVYKSQAVDHGHDHGERAERAGARAEPHLGGKPALARLHAQQPARRPHRVRGVPARLSHVRDHRGLECRRWRARSTIAIGRARRRNPAMESSIFDFLRSVVLPTLPTGGDTATDAFAPRDAGECEAFAVSPCSCSSTPGRCRPRASRTPRSIVTTCCSRSTRSAANRRAPAATPDVHSAEPCARAGMAREMVAATHDTKLGEDHRARLNALSEFPDELARGARSRAACHGGGAGAGVRLRRIATTSTGSFRS